MPRKAAGLTATKVEKAKPGRYGDGNGLYLLVRPDGGRWWVFRWVRNGRMREMGLGRAPGRTADAGAVTLAKARLKAGALFEQVRDGIDPLDQREVEKAEERAEAQRAVVQRISFRAVAEKYIAAHEASWRNDKHIYQWGQSLGSYVFPHIGDLPVAEVGTGHIVAALESIWTTKPETATRVRGRIEAVLDYAKALGWRTGENPARWRGHLANLLPARKKIAAVEHHAALPWQQIGAFMVELRERDGSAALALEFAVLTAARTGEALGARWGEIDMAEAVWTVPAERMKMKKEHRVPLSGAALDVLRQAAELRTSAAPTAPVFPGQRPGQPLSNMALMMLMRRMGRGDLTVHGFRSAFRDWAAERTSYPNEVAEAALAHVVADKVEAAYRRGDLFEKRRRLMADWAAFCARQAPEAGQVVPIRATDALSA